MESIWNSINSISIQSWGIIVAIFLAIVPWIWKWKDNRKLRPRIRSMTFYQRKGYFGVLIRNNSNFELIVKAAYRKQFLFIKKKLSIGTSGTNNIAHANMLASQKKGNLDFKAEVEDSFYLYVNEKEKISKQTFIFKTNQGKCSFKTGKI